MPEKPLSVSSVFAAPEQTLEIEAGAQALDAAHATPE
jgi:hypothetical protein